MAIELALTPVEELKLMKDRLRAQAEAAGVNWLESDVFQFPNLTVKCVYERKIRARGVMTGAIIWYANGRRIGENHVFGEVRKKCADPA